MYVSLYNLWWQFLILAIISYLIGNINFAVIISKLKKNDIRKIGSGNPGTLNMSRTFGLKIGLEGEKEFKKSIADINQTFKVLGSEMKLVTAQYDANDTSIEALTARQEALGKQVDAQRQKVETLRAAMQNAAESFGENDRRTQAWQIQLNNAEAALIGMEKELEDNTVALDRAEKGMDDAGDSADEMADDVVVMYCGQVVEQTSARTIFTDCPVSHPYTEGLMSSIPRLDSVGSKIEPIPGVVPHPLNLPKGCKFAPRCKYCTGKCMEQEPPLTDVGNGQLIRCFYPNKEVRNSAEHKEITVHHES